MADAQKLRDFFVGIGFNVDKASQTSAEAAVKKSEATITKATQEALKARRIAEDEAYAGRIEAAVKAGRDLDREEKAAADRIIKRQEADEAKRQKLLEESEKNRQKQREESAKKERDAREKALKNMQAFTLKAAGFALKAFTAIEGSALGVVYAVDRAAKSFERLNYTSARSGAAPGKVGAFGYAAGQLGSSKEEAEGQLQSFGQKLKTNAPGYSRALARLGINTRDANGQLRDSVDLATDLGDALRKMQGKGPYGYANALNQAHVFGFEGDTARALMNPDFRKRAGQYGADQAKIGADPDGAAKSGTAFEQSMRHLNEVLEQIGTKINGVLFEKLKPLLDQLAAWFLANGDRIADIVSRIADDLVKLATAIGQSLAGADWKTILDNIETFAKGLGSLVGKLSGEGGLIALIAALAIGLKGLSLLAMPPWVLALLGVGVAGAVGAKVGSKALDNAIEGDGSYEAAKRRQAGGIGPLKRLYNNMTGQGGRRSFMGRSAGGTEADPLGGHRAKNNASMMAALQDQLVKEGVSKESAPAAAAALMGNVVQESGGDPTKIHDGGTGYGIYGARLDRRTKMLHWLSANGFAKDSAEGQAKYMAHEAMTSYPHTAEALRNAKPANLGAVTNTVATDFESPAPATANYAGRRDNAAAALRTVTPVKTPPMLKAKPLAIGRDPLGTNPDAGYVPGQVQGLRGGGYIGEGLDATGKPVVLSPQHTSYRGDTNVNHNQTFNIAGGDAKQNMEAARLTASRGQQDLLRNVQGVLA